MQRDLLHLTFILLQLITFVRGLPGRNPVRTQWTAEEDAKLLELYEKHKNSSKVWSDISQILQRTQSATRSHYKCMLDPNIKTPLSGWSEEEHRIISDEIKNAKKENRKPRCSHIARQMNRSRSNVYHYCVKLIEEESGYRSNFTLWTGEEDACILQLYEKYKESPKKWVEMSLFLNRKPESIRDHYYSKLNPNLKNPKSEWTDEEIRIITEEIENSKKLKRSPKWAEIARQLNRSRKAVYNKQISIRKMSDQNLNTPTIANFETQRRTWTAEEDLQLFELYEQYKPCQNIWTKISHKLNRTPAAIRGHFNSRSYQNLQTPEPVWTEKENQIMLEEFNNAKIYNRRPRWAGMARQLNRTRKAINQWIRKAKLQCASDLTMPVNKKGKFGEASTQDTTIVPNTHHEIENSVANFLSNSSLNFMPSDEDIFDEIMIDDLFHLVHF